MGFTYKGIKYRSKKHPLLEYIFNDKTQDGTINIGENHTFTLADISAAYKACGIPEPASISNTILDLTRQDRGIASRLPESIYKLGYDLRKKTGRSPQGNNYAGEFVFVGVGNFLNHWFEWPLDPDKEVTVQNIVPESIIEKKLLGNDEGALFSVIDYCDVLSIALYDSDKKVIRVQNPKKWQPNEIDGLYYCEEDDTLYPCEAKAISTGDSINMVQLTGGYRTITKKMPHMNVTPVALVMVNNGINIGLFKEKDDELVLDKYYKVNFSPEVIPWR